MRLIECLLLPTQTDNSNDNNESVTSQISGDDSEIIPVDEYIKPYLMKGGIAFLKILLSKHLIIIRSSIQAIYENL